MRYILGDLLRDYFEECENERVEGREPFSISVDRLRKLILPTLIACDHIHQPLNNWLVFRTSRKRLDRSLRHGCFFQDIMSLFVGIKNSVYVLAGQIILG